MSHYEATIEECGNGLAGEGEFVSSLVEGAVYRVIEIVGRIHTGAPGQGNYVHAVVELARWEDVPEDEDPYCTAVIGSEVSKRSV